jgi:hypothetical protein
MTAQTTKTPTEEISAAEALKRYVAHLISESWCIDTSGSSMRGFQATSNREQTADAFALGFRAWAIQNGVRVVASEYRKFRKTLKEDVIERLPHVLGSSFRPTPERFFKSRGALMANTYIPPAHPKLADYTMPEIHWEMLARLFPDEQQRKYVVQYFAHMVKQSHVRPQFGLHITGVPGCGKSTLIDVMRLALGGQYVWHEGNYTPMFKQFSEVLPNNLLVCSDDAVAPPMLYERLKHATTSAYQEVEIKTQQKTVLREVYARIVVINNHALKLPPDDRRFYVPEPCRHKVDKDESDEFFRRYREFLDEPGTPALLHHWLMSVDLTGFLVGSTIQTEAHARMVDDSMSTMERVITAYVEGGPIFHEAQLLDHLKAQGVAFPKPDDVAQTLKTLVGYQHKRRPVRGCTNGAMVWLWSPPAKRSRSLTEQEEEAIRQSCGATF